LNQFINIELHFTCFRTLFNYS